MARNVGLGTAWALVGAAAVIGSISLGPFVLLPALAAFVVLITRTRVGVEAFGALAGAGAVLLLIAYIHRGEQSGWHCSTTPDSVECGEGFDPRPWLIAGLLLVGISVALVARHVSGRTTRRL
jgi:hypothetical protein